MDEYKLMAERAMLAAGGEGPLGIVCGGGSVPAAVAAAVTRGGRPVVLFALRGIADSESIAHYPHHWVSLGKYNELVGGLRMEGCRDIVFIGAVVRPALRQLRFDLGTLRMLPKLIPMFRGGDNHLLSGLVRLFENEGFRVIGAHEVASELLMPLGVLATGTPSDRDHADIAHGLALIATLGPFDVGQAAVVANNHVLAIEAIEGTDQMLTRIAELRRLGRIRAPAGRGVMIKAPKPGQEMRVDLPSIGPQTIEGVARAGLAGLAVVADQTIVADIAAVGRIADRAGLFVIGVRAGGSRQ
jgi:UDP-2,3-diacylglucosamine hydrolase